MEKNNMRRESKKGTELGCTCRLLKQRQYQTSIPESFAELDIT